MPKYTLIGLNQFNTVATHDVVEGDSVWGAVQALTQTKSADWRCMLGAEGEYPLLGTPDTFMTTDVDMAENRSFAVIGLSVAEDVATIHEYEGVCQWQRVAQKTKAIFDERTLPYTFVAVLEGELPDESDLYFHGCFNPDYEPRAWMSVTTKKEKGLSHEL